MASGSRSGTDGVSVLDQCAVCDSDLNELDRWYPSLSVEYEGTLCLFSFCSDRCKTDFRFDPDEWL